MQSKLIAAEIEDGLKTRRLGRSVLCFDEVSSTNDIAWDSAKQDNTDGLTILAESQLAGRGRQGRQWISPPGSNILASVLLVDPAGKLNQEAVTIAAGLAIAEAVEETTSLHAELKWPNDVLLYNKKLAGVLLERQVRGAGQVLVVGMGLNVASCPKAEEIGYEATSLAEHQAALPSRKDIVRSILQKLDLWLIDLEDDKLTGLHEAWLSRCGMLHQRVMITSAGKEYSGRVLDIDPLCGLLLADDFGSRVHIPAAGATIVDTTNMDKNGK